MADRKASVAVAAREKARRLKAERDQRKADEEKEILGLVEQFHLASGIEEHARTELEQAQADQLDRLADLIDLDVKPNDIETMCAVDAAAVRAARKQLKARTSASTEPSSGPVQEAELASAS